MKKQSQQVSICTMKPYFLYLPITYAIGTDCFGLLNKDEFELKERQAWPPLMQTDDGVCQILTSSEREYENVWFALCDPAELLKPEAINYFRSVRVIGTIVCSSAFWAVNHNEEECRLFSDLSRFEKIIAYRAGTTSHGIASNILKHKPGADPSKVIIEVEVGGEQRRFENSGVGTLMISPSVDTIEWLVGKNRNFHVMLDIGLTPEYSNVLTTALLVRAEVVEKNPDMVHKLLSGVQIALDRIHGKDLACMTFAEKSADYGDYAEKALNRAIRCGVIPQSIEVKRDSWLRAAEKYFVSQASNIGTDDLKLKMQHAAEVYKCCVEPVAELNLRARECAKNVARGGPVVAEKKSRMLGLANVLLGIVIGTGFTYLCFRGPLTEVAIAVGIISVGFIIQQLMKFKFWSLSGFIHWFAMFLSGIGGISLHGKYFPVEANIGFLTGGATFWLGCFMSSRLDKSKNQ